MAVHDDNTDPYGPLLKTSDLRTLRLYNVALNAPQLKDCFPPAAPYPSMKLCAPDTSAEGIKDALRTHLRKYFFNEDGKNLAEFLIETGTKGLLALSRFDWLKSDEHACMYFYTALSKKCKLETTAEPRSAQDVYRPVMYPSSHKERFEKITQAFDHPFQIPLDKNDLIETIKHSYSIAYQAVREYKWLCSKNEVLINWAWDYLKKYHGNELLKDREMNKLPGHGLSFGNHFDPDNTAGIPMLNDFHPTGAHETYLAIYCVLRLWDCHPAEKTLFIRNFSKAWRQREARQKKDQKTINAFVSITTKEKLDALRKIYRMPIGEVLEILIEDEYARHQPDERSVRKKN